MTNCLCLKQCLAKRHSYQRFQPEAIVVTPSKAKQPVSLFGSEFCEEHPHPHSFPKGKFDYKAEREMQIMPSRYFNQILLSYSHKFASDSDYIFFAHFV